MNPTRRVDCPSYARLVPKKSAKSPAWSYFGLPCTETGELVSENLAICQICKYPVSSKGGSTTNLFSHLKNHHPIEYSSLNNGNRRTQFVAPTEKSNNNASVVNEVRSAEIESADSMPPKKKTKDLAGFSAPFH